MAACWRKGRGHIHHLIRKVVKVWTSPISSKFSRWLLNLLPTVRLLGAVEDGQGGQDSLLIHLDKALFGL